MYRINKRVKMSRMRGKKNSIKSCDSKPIYAGRRILLYILIKPLLLCRGEQRRNFADNFWQRNFQFYRTNQAQWSAAWTVPESFSQGTQRALCSKLEDNICAVCTNNAHRWILLYCSAGSAATPQSVLFFSGCKTCLRFFWISTCLTVEQAAPFLFSPASWTPIWPLILSILVLSCVFHEELGDLQKSFGFCEVFSKVGWDTFVRISIESQI